MQRAKPIGLSDNTKVRKTKATLKGQKIVEDDLKAITNTLQCPDNVTGIAAAEWKRIVDLWNTTEYKYLNDLDMATLKCYCDSVERYELARETWIKLNKKIAVNNKDGQKLIDRCLQEMSKTKAEIESSARALCLTVVDRERLAIANGQFAQKQKSALMRFIEDG
jgi:P27 family predicted phage terminase small subunit